MTRPNRQLLTIWRIILVLIVVPVAFSISITLSWDSTLWLLLTILWVACFLAAYLLYLPLRFRKLAFCLDGDKLLFTTGVFYHRVHIIPLQNVQFTSVRSGPIHRLFSLATLVVTAAGGRVLIPGLLRGDALALSQLLSKQ